jgi:translocation and assembly module TamB
VQGDERGPSGDAKIHLQRGLVKYYGFGEHVRLSVLFDRDRIRWDGVAELIREGGAVALRGELGLGEGLPLQLEADVRDVNFSKLMEQLEVSPNAIVQWTLAGGFDLKGTCDPLDLRGRLDMPTRDFRVTRDAWHADTLRPIIQVPRAHLVGQVRVKPAGIFLEQIDIAMPSSRLFADRVLLGFDNELEISAQALDWALADSSPLLQFPLGGRGTFEVDVTGTFNAPIVSGQVAVRDFTFNAYRFGDMVSDFSVDEDLMGVRFPSMEVSKNDSRYRLRDGFLDFRDDRFRTGAQVDIAHMTLEDFYHVFHWEEDERYEAYAGKVEGTVGVDYTLGFPDDSPNGTMTADIDLAVPEAQMHGYALRNGRIRGEWKWRNHELGYRGGELSIERAVMRKGDGTLSLSGKMGLDGVLDVVIVGDRISLRDLEGVREGTADLRGRLGVTANVKGTLANPRADIDLTTTGVTYQAEPLGDGRAYIRLTDKSDPWIAEALKWPEGEPPADEACGHGREGLARGEWPEDPPLKTADGPVPALDQPMAWVVCGDALDGQLQADIAIGRTKIYPLRGHLRMHGLTFGRLLPRDAGTVQRGIVSGEAVIRGGAASAPHTLVGRVAIDDLVVGQLDVELHNDGPVALTFDRGRFDIENARLVGPASELFLHGSGSLQQGLALSVDGHLDLSLFTAVAEDIDAAGQIDLQFKVTGAIQNPQVYGSARLRDGMLRPAGLPLGLDNVRGDVTFSAHRIVFDNFVADVGGGRVALAGVASLRGPRIGSYDLTLEGSGVTVALVDGLDLRLGGRGNLGWQRGDRLPKLEGTLQIEELAYTRPVKMARAFDDLYGAGRVSVKSYDPDADRLALDLAVVHTDALLLRNNLIDAELAIDDTRHPFRLVGTDQRYGLVGDMSVRKGTVRFRGKDFDVRSGDIHFNDETRIDPRFDVSATTEVRRQQDQSAWRVQIHTWGSRDAFQFQLSSDPALSEDDIALLLTVGMTHSELSQVEAGQLTSTAALEALATVTGVEGEVQKAVPEIDEIQIASAYSEHSNRTEPQVFVGKRIAERVRLSAATGIGESRDFKTGVELEVSDQTSVEAIYNNQNANSASRLGDVGVDLKWRLEFD